MSEQEIFALLRGYLQEYSRKYQEYNTDPQAWTQKFGDWVQFEHLEKAKLLQEIGRILELLSLITRNEQRLDTLGDLEYYSTATQYLTSLRMFLEDRTKLL
ncbi:MAG: hypothetical protein ACK4QL_03485 [Pseudanabaenaceae cyanobacterium]